jgi:hypothetical protein
MRPLVTQMCAAHVDSREKRPAGGVRRSLLGGKTFTFGHNPVLYCIRSCDSHVVSKTTRAQLKRDVPSFTVEIRQHKRRPISESPSVSWVDAKSVPAVLDHEPRRIAAAAFKTVEAVMPSEGATPPPRPGRILPSLEAAPSFSGPAAEAAPETPERPRIARRPRAARVVEASQPAPSSREDRARIQPPRDEARAEPRRDAAAVSPPTFVASARVKERRAEEPALAPKREPQPRPAPRSVAHASPAREVAPEPPPASQAAPNGRSKRAILARYVLRDESQPGQIWKRKLLARRENRT